MAAIRTLIERRLLPASLSVARFVATSDALQNIQAELTKDDIKLSLVQIFDIALWFSHPAAGVERAEREITVRLR